MPVVVADAALAAAQRYCGWPVKATIAQVVELDGSGARRLWLPTMCLNEVTSVIEDGTELDVATLRWSQRGELWKASRACWAGESKLITVTMNHGYSSVPDFDKAVEDIAASMTAGAGRDDAAMTKKKVDDVEYDWDATAAAGVLALHASLLDPYRILISP